MTDDDDRDLGVDFASGDPDAVRRMYGKYGRLVYAVAFRVLGDAALAEDATQRAFVQAWRAAGRFDPTQSMPGWLATIARRAAIDVYRQERRLRTDELDESTAPITLPPSADRLSDIWDVRSALALLPEQDQTLLRLQHYESFTQAEVADHLGIPVGTVKSRSHRAHRRLAELLQHLKPQSPGGENR